MRGARIASASYPALCLPVPRPAIVCGDLSVGGFGGIFGGIDMTIARHLSSYSQRAKIGLVVPPTNTVNEAEWCRMVPEGVTFHTVRMPIHSAVHTEEERRALTADISRKVEELAPARVDVVAYACTAGSMVTPPHQLPADVSAATGIPVVTTAAAIVDALQSFGARQISIATPYHDALNDHEVAFLRGAGIHVRSIKGLGLGANAPVDYPRIAETPLAAVRAHAMAAFAPGSDALLISCTDFPTLPLIASLESELGVPVVTSNQATLWAALRAAEISEAMPNLGRLFSAPQPA
jgi:maleate cis-trans isomerase